MKSITRLNFLIAAAKVAAKTPLEKELVQDAHLLSLQAEAFLETASEENLVFLDRQIKAWNDWKAIQEEVEEVGEQIKKEIGLS